MRCRHRIRNSARCGPPGLRLLVLLCSLVFTAPVFAASILPEPQGPLQITGATRAQESNIRAWIGEPVSTSEAALRAFMRRAKPEAQNAMQALGHYHAKIRFRLDKGKNNERLVTIRVEPGPPVTVNHITFVVAGDAADDGTYKLLRQRWKLDRGDVFHHGRWDDTKRGVRELLRRRGFHEHYIKSQEARVDLATRQVHLDLRIESGIRYTFGETSFDGAQIDPELMEGYLPWTIGDPFDTELVHRLERILQDTHFFSRIEVTTEVEAASRSVRSRINVAPREKNALSVGPGISTDTGPRLRFAWEKPWLGANGHSLRTSLDVSAARSQFDSAYTIPMLPPIKRALEFNLNWLDEDIDDHQSERLRTAIQYRRMALLGWDSVHFLRLEQESFDTGNDQGKTLLLIPGTNWSRTRRQGGALATWGDRVFIELQGASESFVSDLSLVRVHLGTRWLRTLYADSRLHLRLDAGALLTDRFADTPTSLRFFAGGDRSIRGFDYQSLGPKDASGEVIGGRQLLVGSAELDWPVAPDWRAAIFIDGGGAFDTPSDPYQVGFGGGARWLSPVGPVRLDLAFGVDEDENTVRLHFSLGPDL